MSDRGLQPERTALAWQRTGLSAAVAAALLLRTGFAAGSVLDLAAGGCAVVVVVLCWLTARRPGTRPWRLRVSAGAACVTALLVTVRLVCE
ncbi:DUF202 domain-containing protein [Amycolatopsis sp. FDAARGOS 1241]|uniref:DUF202 domain-containing protein n=1 Tax=Amycolatopsis sp. FDAARGOS 1241 TaxID=2778070 RepID=UPI00194E985C|nr:DUF202 domain-containing protein [Amycolatopsis sp. FDAARGOS 1241]QRP44724.1 DUF202 domain-containing protein [Amycolatopsis sp. FDAARGOS 1241]